MESAKDFQIVLVTIDSHETAEKISQTLVRESLAACINILPGITSIYQWKGEVEKSSEILLLIKTKLSLLGDLEKRILDLHPYDCPEIVSFDLQKGQSNYLTWLDENTISRR